MNILFVCRHNRFRSKVAEALFKKHNKCNVKSAGIRLDLDRPYVAPIVKEVLLEYGVNRLDDTPKLIDSLLIRWANKIIIVADNVDSSIFPKEKVEV